MPGCCIIALWPPGCGCKTFLRLAPGSLSHAASWGMSMTYLEALQGVVWLCRCPSPASAVVPSW